MSDVAIKIEGVGKRYTIGKQKDSSFRESFGGLLKSAASKGEDFWALKDISFEVNKAEVIGIIGRNGAGKSTLLKVLSQITKPTEGKIEINGRVASLLEVGTGFHPELTGRENIYLNGTILGMTRKEVKAKFDEIVEFSGVGKFIETPVKHYSSGMYVRLAFAVAAYLEPEILIIDEVLAVGDAEFQKKCLGKMKDVAENGRTVIFVSHNMAAVKSLCSRCIVLENGGVKMIGDVENVISYYLRGDSETLNFKEFGNEYENAVFKLNTIKVNNKGKQNEDPLSEDNTIELTTSIFFKTEQPERYHITYHLNNELGEALFSFSNKNKELQIKKGENKITCTFPGSFFQSGQYFLSLFIVEDKRESIFNEKDIMSFTVVDGGREIGVYMGREPGYIKPQFEWTFN